LKKREKKKIERRGTEKGTVWASSKKKKWGREILIRGERRREGDAGLVPPKTKYRGRKNNRKVLGSGRRAQRWATMLPSTIETRAARDEKKKKIGLKKGANKGQKEKNPFVRKGVTKKKKKKKQGQKCHGEIQQEGGGHQSAEK